MSYAKELSFLAELVKRAGDTIAVKTPSDILQKSQFDLVTDVDKEVEGLIIDEIKKAYPSDNILSEEGNPSQKIVGRTWTVDPIDGTCNMAHGLNFYGVQCALIDNGTIVVSAIYHPFSKELFTAEVGKGAFLNGNRICVSANTSAENAIIGFSDYTHKRADYALAEHSAVYNLINRVAKFRFLGAACIDFAYVAAGRLDAYSIRTSNTWDRAPGILLCKEAGAVVTSFSGKDYDLTEDVIVAANKEISRLLIEAFS